MVALYLLLLIKTSIGLKSSSKRIRTFHANKFLSSPVYHRDLKTEFLAKVCKKGVFSHDGCRTDATKIESRKQPLFSPTFLYVLPRREPSSSMKNECFPEMFHQKKIYTFGSTQRVIDRRFPKGRLATGSSCGKWLLTFQVTFTSKFCMVEQ